MPRSFTKSQIDRLGARLRQTARPAVEDLETLQSLRLEYDPYLVQVEQVLRAELGLAATSRLKTVGTIVDKLKRDRTRLSTMQDIAGIRIVAGRGLPSEHVLAVQDRVVNSICELFPDRQVIDRRMRPSHGYRAVHIVVRLDDCPVEIQVRTHLQDIWAQLVESAADRLGRQIRYGGPPSNPTEPVGRGTAAGLVVALMKQSALFARIEELSAKLTSVQQEKLAPLRTQGRLGATGELNQDHVAAVLAELQAVTSEMQQTLKESSENLKDFLE